MSQPIPPQPSLGTLRTVRTVYWGLWSAIVAACFLLHLFYYQILDRTWILGSLGIRFVFPTAVVLVFAIIFLRVSSQHTPRQALPPAVTGFILWLVLFGSSGSIEEAGLRLNFWRQHDKRTELCRLIASGALPVSVNDGGQGMVTVPDRFDGVVMSGDKVRVLRRGGQITVIFFTYLGFDCFEGFVYSSDGSAPLGDEIDYRITVTPGFETKWFYIAAT